MREKYRDHTFKAIKKAYTLFLEHGFTEMNKLNDWYEMENKDQEVYNFTLEQCKKFNILDVDGDKIISTRVWDLELYLVNELIRQGLKDDYIQKIVKQFQEERTRTKDIEVTLFYIFMVMKKATVNIYVFDDDVTIKTAYGHDGFTQHHNYYKSCITVNLNAYISTQYEEDYMSTIDKKYYLSESERDLISNVRDDSYQRDEIVVQIKQNKIKKFDVFGREYDLSQLTELHKKIKHGRVGVEIHEGESAYITIKEKRKIK